MGVLAVTLVGAGAAHGVQAQTPGNSKLLIAQAGGAEQLTWQKDLSASLKQATAARKWVLVDVYTDWCGWCKKMDSDTFTDASVARTLNSSFICVKVNADAGSLGSWVKRTYDVHSYPCILVLEPNGRLKAKLKGYQPAEKFRASLASAVR